MADELPLDRIDRIDRAIARIESAATIRERQNADLARRHAALKQVMGQAVSDLDALIAREGARADG